MGVVARWRGSPVLGLFSGLVGVGRAVASSEAAGSGVVAVRAVVPASV